MIAITKRATKTKSPRQHAWDLMSYILDRSDEDAAVIMYSDTFLGMNIRQAKAYMAALAAAAPSAKGSTVHHIVLTWNDQDKPTKTQMQQCAARIVRALGATDLECIAVQHHDTDHAQVHLVINRVDPVTNKVRQLGNKWPIRETVKEVARINKDYSWDDPDRVEIRNAKWKATATGEVVRQQRPDHLDMSGGARDAEWAAHREGRESTADRVRAFRRAFHVQQPQSWQDFHELAAAHGLSYIRKGKGAIWNMSPPNMESQSVKASSALELSYAKLSKKYGEYKHFDIAEHQRRQEEKKKQEQRAREYMEWWDSIVQHMSENQYDPTAEDEEYMRLGTVPPAYMAYLESMEVDRSQSYID